MTAAVGLAAADPLALQAVNDYVKLDIPAKADYVVLGRLALAGLIKANGFSEDAIADLKLALTEACSNSVRHAYGDDGGQVHLTFTTYNDRVTIEICDDGAGFDRDEIESLADEGMTAGGYSEGGMGLSIIRAVVDDFALRHQPDGGTSLLLTKLHDR